MNIFIPNTQGASIEAISKVEKQFGGHLPHSYIKFLREHDGAKPEDNLFKVGKNNGAGVEEFIPANECAHIKDLVEGFPDSVVPIARATGGNYVYLDPIAGAIYFWDHELDADTKLANSFDEFLNMLERFDPSKIQLKPGQLRKIWVDPKFKPEF